VKTAEQSRTRTGTWLDRTLTSHVAAGSNSGFTVGLDAPSGKQLQTQWAAAREWALSWRHIEPTLPDGATLTWETRLLGGSRQQLPTRLVLASIDTAASWAGGSSPARLGAVRERWAALNSAFPVTATEATLRAVLDWPSIDLDLLLSTAAWFATHPEADRAWTPRQVPVPGLHAKWLDAASRRTLIARLVGLDHIDLRSRPTQVRVTYIDPDHATAGRRRWDIITAGDVADLPYPATTVLIVENRDTAFYFPPTVPSGVVVLGNGDAAVTAIATVASIMSAAQVVYWGDIDAEGLRIVSRIRSRGHHIDTILMDVATYDAYASFGTNLDPSGRSLAPGDPNPPPLLTEAEAQLYRRLTDPGFAGHRRIEQERIPLRVAVDLLAALALGRLAG
jgi:hypothetical protein